MSYSEWDNVSKIDLVNVYDQNGDPVDSNNWVRDLGDLGRWLPNIPRDGLLIFAATKPVNNAFVKLILSHTWEGELGAELEALEFVADNGNFSHLVSRTDIQSTPIGTWIANGKPTCRKEQGVRKAKVNFTNTDPNVPDDDPFKIVGIFWCWP